jgi:predicted permease
MTSAFRSLTKSPGFTAIAVAMLALGIGASTACFSLLNAFFLQPPPFARPAELLSIHIVEDGRPNLMRHSYPNFLDYRVANANANAFTDLAFHSFIGVRHLDAGQNVDTFGQLVTANFFELLGVKAALGRTLLPADDADNAPPVVVVSHDFWQTKLGGSPAALGQTLTLNNAPFTIVGVAPAGFRGISQVDAPNFWVPASTHRTFFTGPALEFFLSRRAVMVSVVGRLKPGVTAEQAAAALQPVTAHLAKTFPAENAGRSLRLIPVTEAMLDPNNRADMLRAGHLLIALSALILLIACANLANLLLARAGARQREIAMRVALGASRRQVIKQLLGENFLLAALGGLLGIVLAYWLRDVLWTLRPRFFPENFAITIDATVIGFAILATFATGLLFGLVPALAATRVDLVTIIKRDRPAGNIPLFSFRNLLVSAQVALSVIALVIAGLFLRSLQQAHAVNLGWNAKYLALVSAALAREGYDESRSLAYYDRALERLRAIPGVVDVSLTTRPFLTGGNPQRTIRPQGSPDNTLRTRGELMSYACTFPGFFRSMGIELVAGRDFTAEEDRGRPPVVIINETLARRAWPGEDPIGKTIKLYNSETLLEVVGVARDIRGVDLKASPAPFAWFPLRQQFMGQNVFHIRTVGPAIALTPTLRKELQALDPAVALNTGFTYDDIIHHALWGPRTGATLMTGFGVIALLLASLGIYAVMSHAVGQRTRELGIRIAIGAQSRAILALVLKRGVLVSAFGLLLGLAASLGFTRYIQGFLFEINPTDPLTFAAIAAILTFVALLACYLPARRASRVDPITALRAE